MAECQLVVDLQYTLLQIYLGAKAFGMTTGLVDATPRLNIPSG